MTPARITAAQMPRVAMTRIGHTYTGMLLDVPSSSPTTWMGDKNSIYYVTSSSVSKIIFALVELRIIHLFRNWSENLVASGRK